MILIRIDATLIIKLHLFNSLLEDVLRILFMIFKY